MALRDQFLPCANHERPVALNVGSVVDDVASLLFVYAVA